MLDRWLRSFVLFAGVVSLTLTPETFAQSFDDVLAESVGFGDKAAETEAEPENARTLPSPGLPTRSARRFGGRRSFGVDLNGAIDLSGSRPFGPRPGVKATLSPKSAGLGETVTLSVKVTLPPDGHTYPTDAAKAATQIVASIPPALEPLDETFLADRAPHTVESADPAFARQYEGKVTWSKRFRVVDVSESTISVDGQIDYQVCDADKCQPQNETFAASLTLSADTFDTAGGYVVTPQRNGQPDDVSFQFELVPAEPKPGEEVTLAITMSPSTGYHGLALPQSEDATGPATRITIDNVTGLTTLDKTFIASDEPNEVHAGDTTQWQHDGRVTWQRRYLAGEGDVVISGTVRYQICSDTQCKTPQEIAFALGSEQPDSILAAVAPTSESFIDRSVFATATNTHDTANWPLWQWLVSAFLGGLILNVMPCVLPVIAIKVMGFVQQAGESRGRIFALNAVYSVGVILVFAILGTLNAFVGMGFGGLFSSSAFTIVMCSVVLIAALSLLGVFEIPIPGFVGNTGAGQQEGLAGAFLTGVMATLLATPCTGPFIGTVVGGLTAAKPSMDYTPWLTLVYSVWLMLGVGMASPYIIAGLYPRVIEYLPKPGMWMVHFKQISGFVLLGSIVFFMNGIDRDDRQEFLMALVGLGFACWIIGTFRPHESLTKRWPVTLTALLTASTISYGAYYLAQPSQNELPWQPFDGAALQTMIDQGEPVLIDFTADWCLICKQNEKLALNTAATSQFVHDKGVATFYADYTKEPPELKAWLERFGYSGVPLTVVYPKGGGAPVKLAGPYSESKLLETLASAVEDKTAAPETLPVSITR